MANEVLKATEDGFYVNYWARTVLFGGGPGLVDAVMAFVQQSHQDPKRQIASCLFPDITTRDQLLELIRSMVATYTGAIIEVQDCTTSDHSLVRIRLPLSDGVCAYALGFGKFEWMPVTRQAPYTEIVLPVKTKQYLKDKYNRYSINRSQQDSQPRHEDPTFVHLADVEMAGITKDTPRDTRFWQNTQVLKRARLQDELADLAKGKVTFSFTGPASQFAQTR